MSSPRAPNSPASSAYLTLAVLSLLNLFNYLDRYVMSGVLAPLQKDLRLNDSAAGWAASAFMLGYFVSAPAFGYLGDRHSRKILMFAGVLIWSAATAAGGLAHSFAQLFAIRIFVGFGEAAFVTIGPSWISDLFANPRRNTALTLFYVAIPFGSALGFALSGWFADRGEWRQAFLYAGLPGLLLALLLLFLREPRRGEADAASSPNAAPADSPARFRDLLGLLKNTRYQLLVWGYAAQTFAVGAFGLWGPAFLHRVHGLPLGRSATLFGAMLAGAGLLATLVGGLYATHLRRTIPAAYVWVMTLSISAAVPVCAFALLTTSATLSLVGLGLAMFLIFLPTGPVTSELIDLVPLRLRATGVALSIFITHLCGDWSSPTIVGYLSDACHSLQKGVLILPVMLMIGAIFWLLLLIQSRKPQFQEKSSPQ